MRSFPLVGDVGIVIVRDSTRERQTVPAEYTMIPKKKRNALEYARI